MPSAIPNLDFVTCVELRMKSSDVSFAGVWDAFYFVMDRSICVINPSLVKDNAEAIASRHPRGVT